MPQIRKFFTLLDYKQFLTVFDSFATNRTSCYLFRMHPKTRMRIIALSYIWDLKIPISTLQTARCVPTRNKDTVDRCGHTNNTHRRVFNINIICWWRRRRRHWWGWWSKIARLLTFNHVSGDVKWYTFCTYRVVVASVWAYLDKIDIPSQLKWIYEIKRNKRIN